MNSCTVNNNKHRHR